MNQNSTENISYLTQDFLSEALLIQKGNNNSSTILQVNSHNKAIIYQQGSANDGLIHQTGNSGLNLKGDKL